MILGDIGTARALLAEQLRAGLAGFWRVLIMTYE